jgi:hypothetical protein
MEDELHFGMPGGSREYKDDGDKNNNSNAISTASGQPLAMTELEIFDLRTAVVDGCASEDANDADGHGQEESSQSEDGSMWNVED